MRGQAVTAPQQHLLDDRAYEAAVQTLFARRPEHMVPGLRRIRALCRQLGDPQHTYGSVHITGTNGKTSTARMITAVLAAADQRVGTYTSPHLQDVRERVRIDGTPVDRARFLAELRAVTQALSRTERRLGESVTFFEVLTALGTSCFRACHVDVGVIEVGMGGRWDATNVHEAEVALIGRVGLDHPELGSTVQEVAHEKAGIIAEGATVVTAAQQPGAQAVIEAEAKARGARVLREGTAFELLRRDRVPGGQDLVIRVGGQRYPVHLPLHGAHQAGNAVRAIAAAGAYLTRRGGLSPETAARGLARVRSPGRLESFPREGAATVVLDGAHNPEGARALAEALPEALAGRRVVAVLAVLGDKDVPGVVGPLLEHVDEVVVTRSPCARSTPVDALARVVRRAGGRPRVASSPAEALALAGELTTAEDVVLVTGSLYLVGAVRDLLDGAIG